MDAEKLVMLINQGKDYNGELMLELWKRSQPKIKSIVSKYPEAVRDDLKQEAYIALCSAVSNYNSEYGVGFSYYSEYWIQSRLARYNRTKGIIRLPDHISVLARKYQKTISEFYSNFGRDPTRRELSYLLDIKPEKLEGIEKALMSGEILSLDAPIKGKDNDDFGNLSEIVSDGADPEEIDKTIDHSEMSRELWEKVEALPEEQANIIKERYANGKTIRQISSEMGLAYRQATWREKEGIRKLRKYAKEGGKCAAYYDCYIAAAPIRHRSLSRFMQTWTSETEYEALWLIDEN